jgi:signal transduction histidine kinase
VVPPTDLDSLRAALARVPDPVTVLENLFARAPVGFQIYEASGRSLVVNQAFLELFGSEPPPGYNVLKDEIAERNGVLGLVRRAFAGETVTEPPVWYDPRESTQGKTSEGRRVAIQPTFVPLFDPQGLVTHVAVVFKDLTAEIIQREQLEEERELLAAVIDQVSEGIVMADERGILRLANRAARDLGIRPGLPLSELGNGGGDSQLASALGGSPVQALMHHRGPHGKTHALAASAVPLRRPDGSKRGAVVAMRDETEREQRELEAQQTAHFRERFIGILGHDLRAPLTAVIASASLIRRQKDASDLVRVSAGRIASSADRMGRMISDLLDFTQARLGGGLAVQRRPCDLSEVARAAVDEALVSHPDRQIRIVEEGDARGSFDPDRAAQLVTNLLQNAVVYSPPAEPIDVEVRGLPGHIEIAVTNAGPQIPPQDSAELFNPFRRGDAAGRHSKGLGLGLFIVQQIARAHGGDVNVESGPRRTTFRASFNR